MEERRKIVIPFEPETPHFDAEETLLSARPVVPITQTDTAHVFKYPQPARRAPFYKRSAFLSLIVMAAVGLGLAAGLGIARYRYMQRNAAAPVVAQPQPQAQPAPVVNDAHTAAAAQTPQGDEQAQDPTLPEVKTEETTTVDDNAKSATSEDSKDAKESSKEKSDDDKEDKAKTTTTSAPAPATREKKRTTVEDEEGDTAPTPRAQRRERRVRDRSEDPVDIPRRIERASEQINRIREIFEGRPQRP
ncbi:MAG: hypothetical protein ICV60_21865 [Pyrinomonadaceae bacterium]|nr:hypothetical protein [Pyrinomonadaceae bacterium]